MGDKLIIGSRGSDLALWQANFVKAQLEGLGHQVEIKIIKTQGDRVQDLSFDKLEGKGFFTKELEEELLAGTIDLAVHSHKDLPTTNPEGLIIAAVSYREDPAEVLLINKNKTNIFHRFSVEKGAVIGTSSARRKSLIRSFRPDLEIKELRGNVPTRIQKLREGQYDAILMAKAGLDRLKIDLSEFTVEVLNPKEFIPAPAQGALALQVKETNTRAIEVLKNLHHEEVAEIIGLERKVLNLLDGGCQLPLGAYCEKDSKGLHLWVSRSESSATIPTRLYYLFPEGDINDFAQQVINRLDYKPQGRIYITRDVVEGEWLIEQFKAHNLTLEGKSMIDIQPVRFSNNPITDWVFFSSKNSVKHFFDQEPQLKEDVKYGAIGIGTAQELRLRGYKPDFIFRSASTEQIGQEFAQQFDGKTVLFPQALQSRQSIQKQLPFAYSAKDLYVYQTVSLPNKIDIEYDAYLFTSPSNVEAFFSVNTLADNAQVYSIGPATTKALEKAGYLPVTQVSNADEIGLLEAVLTTFTNKN